MAWNAPVTFVANTPLTAEMLNQQLRDNLNETLPGKATRSGSYFVVGNTNTVIERNRVGQTLVSGGRSTSITWGDLETGNKGPTVSAQTGTCAAVWLRAETWCVDARVGVFMGVQVSGATQIAPADSAALMIFTIVGCRVQGSHMLMFTNLTPGKNTFTAKYRIGTGGGTGIWRFRQLSVFPY